MRAIEATVKSKSDLRKLVRRLESALLTSGGLVVSVETLEGFSLKGLPADVVACIEAAA